MPQALLVAAYSSATSMYTDASVYMHAATTNTVGIGSSMAYCSAVSMYTDASVYMLSCYYQYDVSYW